MSANRILIVEDDHGISDTVALNLRYVGYEVMAFDDGNAAAEYLSQDHSFDLALLDIMLPGIDGFQLFEHTERYGIPVIYMTAKTDSESEVRGLLGGAEDYIVKPFEILELLVRIEKVLARYGATERIIELNGLTIHTDERTVLSGGEPVALTPILYDLLLMFVKNRNIALSRERLLTDVWGDSFIGESRTVDIHVSQLRKKTGLNIVSVPKVGYRLEVSP